MIFLLSNPSCSHAEGVLRWRIIQTECQRCQPIKTHSHDASLASHSSTSNLRNTFMQHRLCRLELRAADKHLKWRRTGPQPPANTRLSTFSRASWQLYCSDRRPMNFIYPYHAARKPVTSSRAEIQVFYVGLKSRIKILDMRSSLKIVPTPPPVLNVRSLS